MKFSCKMLCTKVCIKLRFKIVYLLIFLIVFSIWMCKKSTDIVFCPKEKNVLVFLKESETTPFFCLPFNHLVLLTCSFLSCCICLGIWLTTLSCNLAFLFHSKHCLCVSLHPLSNGPSWPPFALIIMSFPLHTLIISIFIYLWFIWKGHIRYT